MHGSLWPTNATLDLTTGMTVEAWLRPSIANDWQTAIVKEQPGNLVYGIYSNTNANRPQAEVFVGGSTRAAAGSSALPTGAWSHLATTYDGTTLRLYVNGTQVAQLATAGSIHDVELAGPDRRQLGLGRVLQRPDRRGPGLQPRADRERDSERHDQEHHP